MHNPEDWDDSSLIRAWDLALLAYKKHHSLQISPDADTDPHLKRKADSGSPQSSAAQEPKRAKAESADLRDEWNEDRNEDEEDGELSEGELSEEHNEVPHLASPGLSKSHGSATAHETPLDQHASATEGSAADAPCSSCGLQAEDIPAAMDSEALEPGALSISSIAPSLATALRTSGIPDTVSGPKSKQALSHLLAAYYWVGYYTQALSGQGDESRDQAESSLQDRSSQP
ncbi:uncharacterized protein BJ171DRAFT_584526 [Polychytrium aggregatum]|uniref:uncharacterized protein n=1 Tax=Polychytrium aggregatum TaxID=110093 RepID=UPI0022FF3A40|nr:uncharacterized protein BJ171DRAFT_584526 [Polychytrium aggregatum]KAI9202107.1 hypothetical protein BJ171DRAFT_584526 [Polychytrium aggregatum]